MEYTNDLTIFEGIVDAADDVISISDILEKAGNERKIDFLLKRIQEFIKEVEYLHNGEYKKDVFNKLRQLALFVIFSSDLPILEEMKDNPNLELLIGSLPTLPRYVMCEILWNLDIDDIIGEILVYTYPKLAVNITKSLIENFKYFLPDNCLQRLHMLTASCYKLIHQMIYLKVDKELVNQAYDNFILCNKYFLEPPNSQKLDTISEDDSFKLAGDRIYAFLCVLNDCFEVFTKKEYQVPQINDIYLSTMQENVLKEEKFNLCDADKDQDIKLIKDTLLNCNIALIDTCKSLLSEVSIDIFCSWSEFEENGVTLQNIIGDLSYKIKTNFYELLNHMEQVWVMLQLISTKPKDLKQEINNVDSKTIEEKICENTNESVEWLKSLIYRKNICSEDNLLKEMYKNINVLNDDESHKLYNIVYDHLQNTDANREFLGSLAVKCFENCASDIKVELVANHFPNNVFSDTLETEMFDIMATTIFNKLISLPESELSQIYDIFLQNPKKVFKKIFILASESIQQTKIMVKVMTFLSKYSSHKYNDETESCVLQIAKEIIDSDFDTEIQRDNFITFTDEIKHNKILLESKLTHIIIMPSMYIGLKTNDIDKLYFHCKLLHKAYKLTEIVQYRTPVLIMLAQVVETVRWNINSFSALRPTVLDLALELVTSVLSTYDNNIPEKDKDWMMMKLNNMNPLNMYYYRCLWEPPGRNFIEVVSGTNLHEAINHKRIVLWLTQQFCSTSLQEWHKIWNSLEMFKTAKIVDFFHTAIMIIVITEMKKRTDQSEACLLHCLGNYISIIKNKYLQPPLHDSQVENVGDKLVALENSIETSKIEDIKAILLPIFSYIAERREDYSVDMCVRLHSKLKHKNIKDACDGFFSKQLVL